MSGELGTRPPDAGIRVHVPAHHGYTDVRTSLLLRVGGAGSLWLLKGTHREGHRVWIVGTVLRSEDHGWRVKQVARSARLEAAREPSMPLFRLAGTDIYAESHEVYVETNYTSVHLQIEGAGSKGRGAVRWGGCDVNAPHTAPVVTDVPKQHVSRGVRRAVLWRDVEGGGGDAARKATPRELWTSVRVGNIPDATKAGRADAWVFESPVQPGRVVHVTVARSRVGEAGYGAFVAGVADVCEFDGDVARAMCEMNPVYCVARTVLPVETCRRIVNEYGGALKNGWKDAEKNVVDGGAWALYMGCMDRLENMSDE